MGLAAMVGWGWVDVALQAAQAAQARATALTGWGWARAAWRCGSQSRRPRPRRCTPAPPCAAQSGTPWWPSCARGHVGGGACSGAERVGTRRCVRFVPPSLPSVQHCASGAATSRAPRPAAPVTALQQRRLVRQHRLAHQQREGRGEQQRVPAGGKQAGWPPGQAQHGRRGTAAPVLHSAYLNGISNK